MIRKPFEEWPRIVLQGELVLASGTYPLQASFLVETPSGVVAIGTLPVRGMPLDGHALQDTPHELRKWTMWAPGDAARVLTVAAFDGSAERTRGSLGTALTLAPIRGKLPVSALRLRPGGWRAVPRQRIFVVGCDWKEDLCVQTVVPATMTAIRGEPADGIEATIAGSYTAESFRGGAVLDDEGYVIGAITRSRVDATPPGLAFFAESVDLMF
jgi:hypothetical protein